MSIPMIVGIMVFLASVVLSQKVAVNAASRLDDATKLKLLEHFPKRNVNFTIVIFALIIVFLLAIYFLPQFSPSITLIYAVLFLIYIFAKLFLNVRKLNEIGAPAFYIRSVVTSFGLFIGGAIMAAVIYSIGNRVFTD